jgi:hypothetical protein
MFIKPVKQLHNGVFIAGLSILWLCASMFMVYSEYLTVGVFSAWLSGIFLMIGLDIIENHDELDKYVKGDPND